MHSSSPVINRRSAPIARPVVNKVPKIGSMRTANVSNYSKTTATNSYSNKRGTNVIPPIKSFLNDPKCVELRELFMDEDDSNLPDYDKYESNLLINLSLHLREYERQQASQENYVDASRARLLGDEIYHILKMRNSSNIQNNSSVGELLQKEEYEKYVLEKINEFKQQTEIKRTNLSELHSQQIKRLEISWENDKPAKYRKPSVKLIQMNVVEKKSAKTGDYDKAEAVHHMIESQRQKETNDAQENLNTDYRNAKAKLTEKQKAEMAQFDEQRAQSLVAMKNKFNEKRLVFENREKVLYSRKNQVAEKTPSSPIASASIQSSIKREHYGNATKDMSLTNVKPPNDQDVLKREEKRLAEERRRKREYQKKIEKNKQEEAEKATSEIKKYKESGKNFQRKGDERRDDNTKQEEQRKQQQQQIEREEKQQKEEEETQQQNLLMEKPKEKEQGAKNENINEVNDTQSKHNVEKSEVSPKASSTNQSKPKKNVGIIELIDSKQIELDETNKDDHIVNDEGKKDEKRGEIQEIIEIPLIKKKERVFSKEDSEAFKSAGVLIQQIVAGEEFDPQPPLSPVPKKYVPLEAAVIPNKKSYQSKVTELKNEEEKVLIKPKITDNSNDKEKSFSYVGVQIEAISAKDFMMTEDENIDKSTPSMDNKRERIKRKVRRLVVVDKGETIKQNANIKNKSDEKTEISYKGVTINMVNVAELDFEYESDYEYDFD